MMVRLVMVMLRRSETDIYVPDGVPALGALQRTTHLGIGAHQDDLEIMAFHGIAACCRRKNLWFTSITLSDGASSPRKGSFARVSKNEMKQIRRLEQRQAARIGRYSAAVQLGYPSREVRNVRNRELQTNLREIFLACRPKWVYTHNLADKHSTHVAVAIHVIQAFRSIPPSAHPERLYGCEVWRSLDWLPDDRKIALDVSGNLPLARKLLGVFRSQIAGGKRYDLATLGRRRANATYHQSRVVDAADALTFALDLTPLLRDKSLDPLTYAVSFANRLRQDVASRIRELRR